MPASALAVAMPKSSCVCISMSSPPSFLRNEITLKVSNGSRMPSVSQKRRRSAPSSLAAWPKRSRNSRSAREASSALTET